MKVLIRITLVSLMAMFSGCLNIKTHSTIEPIHLTLDVNLKVQLAKELSAVFDEIDAVSSTIEPKTR